MKIVKFNNQDGNIDCSIEVIVCSDKTGQLCVKYEFDELYEERWFMFSKEDFEKFLKECKEVLEDQKQ